MAPPLRPKPATRTTTTSSHTTARQTTRVDETSETEHVPLRVQRKREADRRSQQVAREKVKSRIAYLEQLVQQLSQRNSDGQIACLVSRLSDLQKQNESLAKTLQNISDLVAVHQAPLPKLNKLPTDSELRNPDPPGVVPVEDDAQRDQNNLTKASTSATAPWNITNVNVHPCTTQLAQIASPSATVSTPWPRAAADVYRVLHTSGLDHIGSATSRPDAYGYVSNISDASTEHVGIGGGALDTHTNRNSDFQQQDYPVDSGSELWRQTNHILMGHYQMSGTASLSDSIMNEDVPIRVMIEGWDAVSKRVCLPPAWQVLRRVDELLFQGCHKRERLGILYMIHMLMQFHRDPTPDRLLNLPAWYLKRPSQNLDHSYATNYFPWPGLRERFVFHENMYSSNIFWYLFSHCVRVNWAFDFRDCYRLNTDTGLYTISPDFNLCVREVRNWTMGPEIFTRYPELYGDIPAFNSIPGSVSSHVQNQIANVSTGVSQKRRILMQDHDADDEQHAKIPV